MKEGGFEEEYGRLDGDAANKDISRELEGVGKRMSEDLSAEDVAAYEAFEKEQAEQDKGQDLENRELSRERDTLEGHIIPRAANFYKNYRPKSEASVEDVIDLLGSERMEIAGTISPQSPFHNNPMVVDNLRERLEEYVKRGVITKGMFFPQAIMKLEDRAKMLGERLDEGRSRADLLAERNMKRNEAIEKNKPKRKPYSFR